MMEVVLAGAGGGMLRGVIGVAKDSVTKKGLEINWLWLGLSILVSVILGVIAASFFAEDLRLALLAGYAGADFIEGLMKIKLKAVGEEKADEVIGAAKGGEEEGLLGKLLRAMKAN